MSQPDQGLRVSVTCEIWVALRLHAADKREGVMSSCVTWLK